MAIALQLCEWIRIYLSQAISYFTNFKKDSRYDYSLRKDREGLQFGSEIWLENNIIFSKITTQLLVPQSKKAVNLVNCWTS